MFAILHFIYYSAFVAIIIILYEYKKYNNNDCSYESVSFYWLKVGCILQHKSSIRIIISIFYYIKIQNSAEWKTI